MRRLWIYLCLLSIALPAAAEVRVRTRADGVKLVYNESTTQRARRLADRLVDLADPTLLPRIEHHALNQRLTPRLVRALVQVESGYNPRALSNKGAQGLMQLMPATARALAVTDPFDIDQNLRGGTTYLRRMLDRFGRLELALAAYNAGPGAVERWGGIPPYRETRRYVERVLALAGQGSTAGLGGSASAAPASGRRPVLLRTDRGLLVTTDPPR